MPAAQARARAAGLVDRVRFHLRDYREETRTFDRIVAIGMFEHVGKRHYGEFFGKVRDLLNDDGVCLLHSIGRFDEPAPVNPFIRKYIFPGTDVPALSEVMTAVEKSRLFATDIEILRPPYAKTLKHWHSRFWIGSPLSTTSGSAGCGSSIWSPARWDSGMAG